MVQGLIWTFAQPYEGCFTFRWDVCVVPLHPGDRARLRYIRISAGLESFTKSFEKKLRETSSKKPGKK
jgi:hypothetical protein